jgi:hypothetical protein
MLGSAVLNVLSGTAAQASDFGFHFSGPGYHFDVGRPHYRSAFYGDYCGHSYNSYYNNYFVGRSWHDTSHFDYHPGGYVRHRNHYHYIPAHWDYHEDGHWDHYGW